MKKGCRRQDKEQLMDQRDDPSACRLDRRWTSFLRSASCMSLSFQCNGVGGLLRVHQLGYVEGEENRREPLRQEFEPRTQSSTRESGLRSSWASGAGMRFLLFFWAGSMTFSRQNVTVKWAVQGDSFDLLNCSLSLTLVPVGRVRAFIFRSCP